MKKNIFKKIIALTSLIFILIGFTVPVHRAFSQEKITDYHLLAPLPGLEKTFDPTQANNLGAYLNVIIKLIIGISAVLAVIMIVMGGIQYMTSEFISSKAAGKERIINAIFGLLLALGAYTLLFTINPNLLNVDLSSLTQQTVEVDLQADVPQPLPPSGQPYPNSNNHKYGDPWDDSIGLIQNIPGVTKSRSECSTVGQTNCLSTRNLNPSSLNDIVARCGPVILNGGTEFWQHGGATHGTTHGPGSATVDIAQNTQLNACLSGGQPLVYYHRYGPGNQYLWETNHWHIGR